MAVVAANELLALVAAWVIAYAGIELKLMAMTLLVGIAVSIIDGYHADLTAKASMGELLVIFVVSLVLVILINTIPNVMAGLIPGGGTASAGSSFGASAIMGDAGAAGGASVIQPAFQKASAAESEDGDMLPQAMGGDSSLASAMSGDAGTGDTPLL